MDMYNKIIDDLIETYRIIMRENRGQPVWAVRKRNYPEELVKCTIPFIGKKYFEKPKRILVYASAENLTGYYPGNEKEWQGDWLDDDEQAINRHRKCFEWEELQDSSIFPNVHLQPMNNGCLSTAVYYLTSKLCSVEDMLPREFYETIAFANYGKYSIETELQRSKRMCENCEGNKSNKDYAGNKELLEASHAFVKADVETLKPDYIILPSSIYKSDWRFIDSIKGDAKIVPISQMNTGVINRHIARRFEKYDKTILPEMVKKWYDELSKDGMTGISKENYLSVFSYLDDVIENNIR